MLASVAVAGVGCSGQSPTGAGAEVAGADSTPSSPSQAAPTWSPSPSAGVRDSTLPPAPPEITKRFDGTPMEHFQARIACVRAAGFPVVVQESGSGPTYYVDVPPEQQAAANAANIACLVELGEPGSGLPLTEDQLSILYDFALETRDCLLGLGYPVDEPSSREEFIETYNSGTAWSPYRQVVRLVAGADPDAWAEVNEQCPQTLEEAEGW